MPEIPTAHQPTVDGPFGDLVEYRATCPCGWERFSLNREQVAVMAEAHRQKYQEALKEKALARARERVRRYPYVEPAKAYFDAKNEISREDDR